MKKIFPGSLRFILCVLFMSSIAGICTAAPTRVAFMGDSITCGIGTKNPAWDSYSAQLSRMLGDGWEIGGFGYSASNLMKEGALPYEKQGSFGGAQAFKPDIVVIMLGSNDTMPENWKFKDQFVQDYKDFIRRVRAFDSKPHVFICRPPYISSKKKDKQTEQTLLEELPMIDQVAESEGVKVIDVHAATLGREDLLADGLHPNNAGATVIAETIYAALTGKSWTGAVPDERISQWNGYQQRDFPLNGSVATLVSPKKALPGKPWIWRPQFFDAFPSVDIALLAEGYHVAYINLGNSFGAPIAMNAMDGFYAYLVQKEGLSQKPVLEGFSRGGLFALNWAARNPDKVAALYLDAPVCDFNSWPGGRGKSKCSPIDWKCCLELYKLTEAEALNSPLIPLNNLKAIAEAKIPIIAVAGDADDVVPMDENILILEKRYRELGGEIQVIVKPGVGHHPHSLTDPTPVVKFLLQNAIKPTASQ